MSALIIGVDLGATQFELALANDAFELQERRRLDRAHFAQFCRELSPCVILMEACSSAHYWARALQSSGHQVRLLPAQYVRPYVHRNKTDAADAAALLEAVRCSELRPVPVKTVDQQSVLQLHRLREQYKLTRNARLNFLRAAFQELGVLIPKGLRKSLSALHVAMDSPPTEWPAALVKMYAHVLEEIEGLRKGMIAVEKALRSVTRRDRVVLDLQTICGVGLLTATALRAAVGDIARFRAGVTSPVGSG
jgi:transposase